MEVLISFVAGIASETARSVCGSDGSNLKSTLQWKSNARHLEKETKTLIKRSTQIKHSLESAEKDGRSATSKVNEWLAQVEEIVLKAESIQSKIFPHENERCARVFSCSAGIRFGREVARTLKKVKRLVRDGDFPGGIVSSISSPAMVEDIPGPSIPEDQTTASRALNELIGALIDEKYRRIGVWGMGGVGKTTLVKNLNNKLKSIVCLKQLFSVVIWATVSKEIDMRRVQLQIAERLRLEVRAEESVEGMARRLYQRLKEERFLLIIDDVWAKIDLDCLGIPQEEAVLGKGSKIVMTSRVLDVCRAMMTDVEVEVNVLSETEAWELFCRNAGEVASLDQIRPFAEAVSRECGGLPLAIVTTGAAMRGKTMVKLWKHAVDELQRSVPFVGGIKNQVYKHLKLSYDSLEDNNTKACFLYCALFPEDFSIEVRELARCWLAEGLVDVENHGFENAENKAIAIVEILKDSCLLEDGDQEGTVKMHDVVRDVAIWISSLLEDGSKFLVRSGIGLSEIPGVDFWENLGRASFMNNKINKLPECEMQCSKVSTLLLQGNLPLERVPEKFLQAFQALKVLNISGTRVQSLPHSLVQLTELRALLLHNCFFLKELPSLRALTKLQILDLCATRIRELPKEFENLTNLRQVNLSRTHYLERIQAGIVSKWTCLEVLDMTLSNYHWGSGRESEEGQAIFEELACLKRLFLLSIRLKTIPCLGSEDTSWIDRLRRFQFFIGTTANSLPRRHDKRRVTISGLVISVEWIGWLFTSASSIVLNGCRGLNEMLEDLAIYSTENYVDLKSVNVGSFMGLKSFTITKSNDMIKQGGCPALYDLLPNLEELHLHELTNLTSVSELVGHLGLMFSKLKLIEVTRCPKLKCLISYGNFILTLPNLETIKVSFCEKLEELFNCTSDENLALDPIVPRLRVLELKSLPKVKRLCRPRETWPMLEQVRVSKCNLLRNLPIDVQNGNAIKEICGESQWWTGLNWYRGSTESALQMCFKPIGNAN